MLRRRSSIIGLAAAALALGTGSALGADQEIAAGNNKTLSPNGGSATVNVGDTVTWRWVGPETNHIIAAFTGQAEQWDSDPGVDDIDHVLNFTFAHQFANAGAYNYRCRIHPDKMFGTITVNAPAGFPTATFSVTPPSGVVVGQQVDFDASASSDPDGIVMNYEWDLDGNGSFETVGPQPSHTYGAPGTYDIALRVTDNDGKQDVATQPVTVDALVAPTASFTAAPSIVLLGSSVSYDGSGSTVGPNLTITKYDWDLDGNGTFETSTGTTPAVAQTYFVPGPVTVQLRVTDSANQTAVAQRVVTVNSPIPPPPPAPPADPPALPPTLSVTAAKLQRAADRKGVAMTATCDGPCTIAATGSIALPGKKVVLIAVKSKVLLAGVPTKLTLTVPPSSRALLKKLLGQGKRPVATISIRIVGGTAQTKKVTLAK